MKKCIVNNEYVCYVFHDNIAVVKENDDGSKELTTLEMLDVNDSEIRANYELASWMRKIVEKSVEIRDANGKMVGIDPDAVSNEDLWFAHVFSNADDDKVEQYKKEHKAEIEAELKELENNYSEEDADFMSKEDLAFMKSFIKTEINSMTPEQQKHFLESIGGDDEDDDEEDV